MELCCHRQRISYAIRTITAVKPLFICWYSSGTLRRELRESWLCLQRILSGNGTASMCAICGNARLYRLCIWAAFAVRDNGDGIIFGSILYLRTGGPLRRRNSSCTILLLLWLRRYYHCRPHPFAVRSTHGICQKYYNAGRLNRSALSILFWGIYFRKWTGNRPSLKHTFSSKNSGNGGHIYRGIPQRIWII